MYLHVSLSYFILLFYYYLYFIILFLQIIELINDLFLVPAVQYEGVINCIVWLINLLVKRSVRYQYDMTHLDQMRSELTHRLCQRLTISDTVKVHIHVHVHVHVLNVHVHVHVHVHV